MFSQNGTALQRAPPPPPPNTPKKSAKLTFILPILIFLLRPSFLGFAAGPAPALHPAQDRGQVRDPALKQSQATRLATARILARALVGRVLPWRHTVRAKERQTRSGPARRRLLHQLAAGPPAPGQPNIISYNPPTTPTPTPKTPPLPAKQLTSDGTLCGHWHGRVAHSVPHSVALLPSERSWRAAARASVRRCLLVFWDSRVTPGEFLPQSATQLREFNAELQAFDVLREGIS